MSRQPSAGRRTFIGVSAIVIAIALTMPLHAELKLPARLSPAPNRASAFRAYTDTTRGFSVDVPKKDWLTARGYRSAAAVFVQAKGLALVAIEVETLKATLDNADVGSEFVDYEIGDLKTTWPGAEGFDSQIRSADDGPVVVVEFTRSTASGAERVRQYTLPRGLVIYRVVCVSPADAFARLEPVFENMAATVRPSAPSAGR